MNTNGFTAYKTNGSNGTTHSVNRRNGGHNHDHPHDVASVEKTQDAHAASSLLTVGQMEDLISSIGDDHVATSIETPMREDAFVLSSEDKVELIEHYFEEIMRTLGLDLTDDSLSGTPQRVAKMFVREIFHGLDPAQKPRATVFENKFKYGEMLVEKNISLHTTCEHHFLPIVGKAHVAYISTGTVIGLSKINRIVDYYARRPQVQERLTMQIADEIKRVLNTEDVAVVLDATHFCVASRGIQDTHSSTLTAEYSGRFREAETRTEFLRYLNLADL